MTRIALLAVPFLIACGGSSDDKNTKTDTSPTTKPVETTTTETTTTTTETTTPEPTPAFTIGETPDGDLAIDEFGFRSFRLDGVEYHSAIYLYLTEVGEYYGCEVIIEPVLLEFGHMSPSNRSLGSVIIDLGNSTILVDECGWDDDYILAEFAARGTIEIGLAAARFPEDGPLDVTHERSWGFPGNTGTIIEGGHGAGFAMDGNGEVDPYALIYPDDGTIWAGFYQF